MGYQWMNPNPSLLSTERGESRYSLLLDWEVISGNSPLVSNRWLKKVFVCVVLFLGFFFRQQIFWQHEYKFPAENIWYNKSYRVEKWALTSSTTPADWFAWNEKNYLCEPEWQNELLSNRYLYNWAFGRHLNKKVACFEFFSVFALWKFFIYNDSFHPFICASCTV